MRSAIGIPPMAPTMACVVSHAKPTITMVWARPIAPIATKKTRGPAVGISEGLDRDRAVDESGNQLSVFGRRGARPFNAQEMRKLYISSATGQFYTVSDTPTGPPTVTTTPVRDKATETSSIARPSYDLVPLLLPMGLLFLSRRRRSAGRRR